MSYDYDSGLLGHYHENVDNKDIAARPCCSVGHRAVSFAQDDPEPFDNNAIASRLKIASVRNGRAIK